MAKDEEQPIAEILNLQCVAQSPSFIYDAVTKYPDKKKLGRKSLCGYNSRPYSPWLWEVKART